MKYIFAAALLLAATTLIGCFENKPVIPGYHWNGDNLYDSNGRDVASVVTIPFEKSQGCIFFAANLGYSECTYWETGQQAYDWVGKQFIKQETK